ncbi:unnamed protein product, partial [Hymenolepis diminuta]
FTLNEIISGLWLGSRPDISAFPVLRRRKITAILTVETNPLSLCFGYYKTMFIKAKDDWTQDLLDSLNRAFNFIDQNISKGILVHCRAGISRSATIVIAYLMCRLRISYQDALNKVKQRRWVNPNPHFIKQLVVLEVAEFDTALACRLRDNKVLQKELKIFCIDEFRSFVILVRSQLQNPPNDMITN